jgi:hypothetical protein
MPIDFNRPTEIVNLGTMDINQKDDVLILSASWETRCKGLVSRLGNYNCSIAIVSIYDTFNEQRSANVIEIEKMLSPLTKIVKINANHVNPLPNVREIIDCIKLNCNSSSPRLSIDISSFTRKHLLQLLHGIDRSCLLKNTRFFYTEQIDYNTNDDEPISRGIDCVSAPQTFIGYNRSSLDSLLIAFLGYQGRRTLALWELLNPNITIAVIADPPYRPEWVGRTETQNRYLLSCIPKNRHFSSDALIPAESEKLLTKLYFSKDFSGTTYNYRISPLGTKPQTLGIYRFWRKYPKHFTIMYAAPTKYRHEQSNIPFGRTWLIDHSSTWENNA